MASIFSFPPIQKGFKHVIILNENWKSDMKSETEKNYFGANRIVQSPIKLKGSLIDSPSRVIPTYNPNRVLPTADKRLAKTLEETYKLKENMTAESVLKDLDSMLATFEEPTSQDGESSEKSLELNKKVTQTKSATIEKTPVDGFYFQKSSWTKRYSLPTDINHNVLEKKNSDFRNRVKTDDFNKTKSPKHQFEVKVYSSPVNNASKLKNTKHFSPSSSKSSTLEKKPQIKNVVKKDESRRRSRDEQPSPNKSTQYKIELFKTTEKANSIVRTDTVTSKSFHSPSNTSREQNQPFDGATGDPTLVYSTVRGFDSFMMY